MPWECSCICAPARSGNSVTSGSLLRPRASEQGSLTFYPRLSDHFASRLPQRGATLQEIKELMGHASIEMTLRYAHLCQSNLDRAVALLD
jgi:hypothetical protein